MKYIFGKMVSYKGQKRKVIGIRFTSGGVMYKLSGLKDWISEKEIQEQQDRQDYKQVIEEVIKILKTNKKLDEYSRLEMCNNLYSLLTQYFDSPQREDKDKQEIDRKSTRLNSSHM